MHPMCTPHVPRIARKTQGVACRWLFDKGVILFDKITLHDAPHCMVDPASRWPEIATVVTKVVIMKF
jgi:mevalonate pyrophosphate decarboxylase